MDKSDGMYKRVCSAKTIQSDKKGFFAGFFSEVRETCGSKWIINTFGKLKTDQERILSLFNDPAVCNPILGILENVRPVFRQKDATFSAQRRLQSEKALLLGDHKKALLLANQAVVRAPSKETGDSIDESLTLALAYWTRASILLEMNKGEQALQDLNLAVMNGLNIKHSPDYYIKAANAYTLTGEEKKAKISMAIAEKLYHGDENKMKTIYEKMAKLSPQPQSQSKPTCPPLTAGENPQLEGASNLITINRSPIKGKFVIAKENIKTGDVLLVEKPVAASLLSSCYGSHCQHCFARLETPVGCKNCSGTAFCSHACMVEATETYHKYECEFLDLFIGSGMSVLCYIALRIFTQAKSVDEGLEQANILIQNLCTHSDMREPEDALQTAVMAAFLFRCLQKSSYFGRRKTESVEPIGKELLVATALYGLLQLLPFNAHEIYETLATEKHKFEGSKMNYIAAGVYRTGSHFNHSCCPGLARCFVGKNIILVCVRPLKAGEEVSENYGPNFAYKSLKERQSTLKSRYWFECNCEACRENWHTIKTLDNNVRFKCVTQNCSNILKYPKDINKEVRCPSCKKNVSLRSSVEIVKRVEGLYSEAAHAMQEENTKEALDLFTTAIDIFHEVAVLPHKDTIIAQESFRTCLEDNCTKYIIQSASTS